MSVGAPVLAGLFHLSNYTLYVFLSCFLWRDTIITKTVHLVCKLIYTVCIIRVYALCCNNYYCTETCTVTFHLKHQKI